MVIGPVDQFGVMLEVVMGVVVGVMLVVMVGVMTGVVVVVLIGVWSLLTWLYWLCSMGNVESAICCCVFVVVCLLVPVFCLELIDRTTAAPAE